MPRHNLQYQSIADTSDDNVIVIELAAQNQTRHIFNGIVVEKGEDAEAHIQECNWNPFEKLESADFFYTSISVTNSAYRVVAKLPESMVRYIQVQHKRRELAVVGKAMARRQWTDVNSEVYTNIHELWRVHWRNFRIPLQCDPDSIYALYGEDSVTVVVPRRTTWVYRLINWTEITLRRVGISCQLPATRKSTIKVNDW
ncbi:hypothetical protein COEREDRAFT_87141 [Coemansia reversa NRRL 1564]|uniref:SHSP domain-containing protein n=1 Tax=Coemansia reversa (strain ATCC 12441 / NRRL 1564) TaxID=763665 RepID=A0A2G5BBS9_COERN|nr:hypothetical protein COEREDRAFT_87141 [Coemansia reversa NRRL 1564]|eukprot:PIA16167.1 hypothetical protein COEREDRAFT_87141 [Coemansia reversa NRRL 1564]